MRAIQTSLVPSLSGCGRDHVKRSSQPKSTNKAVQQQREDDRRQGVGLPSVISTVQVPARCHSTCLLSLTRSVGPCLSVAARDLPEPRFGCAGLGSWGRTEPPCMALLMCSVPAGVQHKSLMDCLSGSPSQHSTQC